MTGRLSNSIWSKAVLMDLLIPMWFWRCGNLSSHSFIENTTPLYFRWVYTRKSAANHKLFWCRSIWLRGSIATRESSGVHLSRWSMSSNQADLRVWVWRGELIFDGRGDLSRFCSKLPIPTGAGWSLTSLDGCFGGIYLLPWADLSRYFQDKALEEKTTRIRVRLREKERVGRSGKVAGAEKMAGRS